jgi:hypothetical protein
MVACLTIASVWPTDQTAAQSSSAPDGYADLITLFNDWRTFQKPPLKGDIYDYSSATMASQFDALDRYRERLTAIDTSSWPVAGRIDYLLVWAEMNGLDFDHRVLRPWERMPGFYAHVWLEQSDVPAHEGPVAHGALEVWQYVFPLDKPSQKSMTSALQKTPRILEQARKNLTGDARDLWLGGIRRMEWQKADIQGLISMLPEESDVRTAAQEALDATERFIAWLREKTASKSKPSGIGREQYDWYLKNVHLSPYTWQDEVTYMRSELARGHATLRLEEHKNRKQPRLSLPASAEEYDQTHNEAVSAFIAFLRDEEIVTVRDYMDPALRAKIGSISPSLRPAHFFSEVDYRDPLTMRTHGYHWIELARMVNEPHPNPIRQGPLLYNIFQYRSEGIATGMEELSLRAGLFNDSPRSRELIAILVAMRAARALGGLFVHSGDYTMEEAIHFATQATPRGWFKKDGALVRFEQDLYLSQPGYGSTYLMGKLQLENLMMERAQQLGNTFTIKRFLDEFTSVGIIPISLIRWELTGKDDEISKITTSEGR